MTEIASLVNTILTSSLLICVTVLATMGISLIFKTSNTTNFAQGSIAALGTYVVAALVQKLGVNLWVALIIGLLSGVVIGLLIDILIFRKGRNVLPVGKQIITMGLVSIIVAIIPIIFGKNQDLAIMPIMQGSLVFNIGATEVGITYHSLFAIGITVVVMSALFIALRFTKWGLSVRTTASSEKTAELMGVNTYVVTAATWAIAAGLGVLAAYLFAGGASTLSPVFMTSVQVNAFLAGILGGFSTFYGPAIGAILIPLSMSIVGWLGNFVGFFNDYRDVIVYILLLVVVLIKPIGLFGKRVQKKV